MFELWHPNEMQLTYDFRGIFQQNVSMEDWKVHTIKAKKIGNND